MARIHPPLENWRRVSGEIRTEPLISSGNIRRLQREERPRGDPRRAQPEEAPQPPAESEVYFRSGVSAHVTSYGFSTKKAKKSVQKNRVLKILVPLRYREKLDTNNENRRFDEQIVRLL